MKQWIAVVVCGLLIALGTLWPSASVPLYIAAFLIGGFAKAKEGIIDLVHNRTFNIEILMILAAVGAGVIGYWAEGALLILIFAISGVLEQYTMDKSRRDLSALISLQPDEAVRVEGKRHTTVAVADLEIGDHVLVKPGDRFPIDGKVVLGTSDVDESPVTGESVPVLKQTGDDVKAGTMNRTGSIVMEVTTRPEDTLFQKIVRLVEEAGQHQAPSHRFIKRFERTYVKVVLIAVALMLVIPHYLFGWSWEVSVYRALVLLVVASPCALVASSSPAILSVLSRSARDGLLIKGGDTAEKMASIRVVAMDKTGTITTGEPQVAAVLVREGLQASELMATVAGLELHSAHPLAQAIVRDAEQRGLQFQHTFSGISDVAGKGVYGEYDGSVWKVGSARFVGEEEARRFLERHASPEQLQGKTIVFAHDSVRIAGAVLLEDRIRDDAREAISTLKELGIHVVLISGDQRDVVQSVSSSTGIAEFHAETLPDGKMEQIDRLRDRYGPVMMIGDGINDAPALARADIGVAMGSGTDVALNTSDVVLVKDRLSRLAEAVRHSRKMKRIIVQNIIFSVAVITVLVAANFMQGLSLPHGVIGHEGSTILVILNSLRLLRQVKTADKDLSQTAERSTVTIRRTDHSY